MISKQKKKLVKNGEPKVIFFLLYDEVKKKFPNFTVFGEAQSLPKEIL